MIKMLDKFKFFRLGAVALLKVYNNRIKIYSYPMRGLNNFFDKELTGKIIDKIKKATTVQKCI